MNPANAETIWARRGGRPAPSPDRSAPPNPAPTAATSDEPDPPAPITPPKPTRGARRPKRTLPED